MLENREIGILWGKWYEWVGYGNIAMSYDTTDLSASSSQRSEHMH